VPLVGFRQRVIRLFDRTNRSSRWPAVASLLALAAILAACAGTGQPGLPPQPGNEAPPGFFPTPSATQQGLAVENLYLITFIIAVVVFVLVEGLLLFISFRFRRRKQDTELPTQTHGSNPLEILWTIVPAITVTALFVAALITLNEETEARAANPAVIVDVTGFQWQWTFEYANEDVSLSGAGQVGPTMALPVNETVRIRLHATDVIHSFYVPQFLYKKDAIPGRVNEFDVLIRDVGTYGGQCAEFCGLAHSDMLFNVQAMTRADYDAWLANERDRADATPGPVPSGAPTVQVTSISVTEGFDPATLTVAADTPWVVELTNADPGVPHDFAIRAAQPGGADWQGDPDAQGGGSATYQPPPLAAGEYEFYCSLHPNMTGTLQAE